LYTQKSGEEIVGQLFDFTDKGGRAVSMRPEMTPTFARMVGARAQALRKPVRWFSIPQLFRYERTQKGRLREHFQLNVDLVGETDVLADAELVSIAIEIMRAFGLTHTDVRARVSDRRLLNGLLEHLEIPETAWDAVYAVLDKLERQPREVSAEKLTAAGLAVDLVDTILGFGTLDFDTLAAKYGDAPAVQQHVQRFAAYLAHCRALGVGEWIHFDLTIVRGLAYYTGIVFELFDATGEFRAICGGGRYDTLLKSLGGTDLPALGFGMGDVVIGELLRARGLMRRADQEQLIYVAEAPDSPSAPALALETATMLRRGGLRVETALHSQKIDKQLEAGRKAGASLFIIADSIGGRAWRLRRAGHEDEAFTNLETLAFRVGTLTASHPELFDE
jgi:histidyl-tRNA synthetase